MIVALKSMFMLYCTLKMLVMKNTLYYPIPSYWPYNHLPSKLCKYDILRR